MYLNRMSVTSRIITRISSRISKTDSLKWSKRIFTYSKSIPEKLTIQLRNKMARKGNQSNSPSSIEANHSVNSSLLFQKPTILQNSISADVSLPLFFHCHPFAPLFNNLSTTLSTIDPSILSSYIHSSTVQFLQHVMHAFAHSYHLDLY